MELTVEGRQFQLTPPRWAQWQVALERAAGTAGSVKAEVLLEECLAVCTQDADGSALSRTDVAALGAGAGDRLVAALMEALDQQREALGLEVAERRIRGTGFELHLRPWSFGERNSALRRSMRLVNGNVVVDLAVYELQMVLQCVTTADGSPLSAADVRNWPVPLAEAVLSVLDSLNGVAAEEAEVLEACLRTGAPHPDLMLLELCRAFGWRPADAEQMDARTAERIYSAVRMSSGAPALAPMDAVRKAPPPSTKEEGVYRIVVDET